MKNEVLMIEGISTRETYIGTIVIYVIRKSEEMPLIEGILVHM